MEEYEKLLRVLGEVVEDVDFASEEALVDDGLIDSLDLTQIIVAVNEAFDVQIRAGDIEPENFNSAKAILALIHACREQA